MVIRTINLEIKQKLDNSAPNLPTALITDSRTF